MKVLVVDDDAIAREMLAHALTQEGYEVETAHDGCDALIKLTGSTCRMVISDWEMPGMSGLELCRAVRSGCTSAYVYFIMLTRHGRREDVVAGLEAGADDYMTKPFDHAELKVRIRAGERILNLESRDVTIFAMAKLTESRDEETGAHLERVRAYSRLLAERLATVPKFQTEIDPTFVRLIFETSPLHDIGKVAIPDFVLRKPSSLNDREMEIMRTHTTRGAETLEAALRAYPHAEFLIMARDIAISHHERWDGTGYPQGLAGTDIPLCGRIVSLADVYDAITSPRVYKDPYSHDVACAIILEESGRQFDPDIVEAFRATEQEFLRIKDQHRQAHAPAADAA